MAHATEQPRACPKRSCEELEVPEQVRPVKRLRGENHDTRETEINPVEHWAREGNWPRRFFERDPDSMERLLARKRSSSISRKRSASGSAGSVTPSDQRTREEKSAPYRDPRYKTLLETKGSFMGKSELGITEASKQLCRTLLDTPQTHPQDSLFRDDIFETTCSMVEDRNEARVLRDITPLIVPSAEILAAYGAGALKCLIEGTNEGWNNSIPLTGTRPQPDYAVGFKRSAFTDSQLDRLSPFIGEFLGGDQSLFMATYLMYFPFFTCEVKRNGEDIEISDRQNAHSMTLAVRGVVDLFRLVKREKEVDRQILAFSVSHNHRSVRIYGHYPVINGEDTKYYRHPIRIFDFLEDDGRHRWAAHHFTRNVYEIWMPTHFEKICSAVDQIPSHLDFSVLSLPGTGLSQDLEGRHLSVTLSDADLTTASEELGRSSSVPQPNTPGTSSTGLGRGKRVKKG